MRELTRSADVVVVGGGAIGASVAYWLASRGADVVVIERGNEWGVGCSRANAGWICPSHAGPFARRRDIVDAIRWLSRRDSPFAIRATPALVPWLLRLALATSDAKAAKVTETVRRLADESLKLHAGLAKRGVATGFRQMGLLDVFTTAREWSYGHRAAERQGSAQVLGVRDALEFEPALSKSIAGAVLHPNDAHCDPLQYVTSVGDAAIAAGARFHGGLEVHRLESVLSGTRVFTACGYVDADATVVAAGVDSASLVRRTPVVAGKGYSLDLRVEGSAAPRRPLLLTEARVAVTPLEGIVRLAGTMELGGRPHTIDRRRTGGIEKAVQDSLPSLRGVVADGIWTGQRPCTSDGLPIVGWSQRQPRVVVATGHAMLGLTLAPVTGRIVADLLDGSRDSATKEDACTTTTTW